MGERRERPTADAPDDTIETRTAKRNMEVMD